ncbi:MAG: DUF3108 domain-containing protein [Planctomycetaceae bacterium]|nr:DUF3108 domain-containing protein [Planctomycetaceae bacterium]
MITASVTAIAFLAALDDAERIVRLIEVQESRYRNVAAKHDSLFEFNNELPFPNDFPRQQQTSVWQVRLDEKFRTCVSASHTASDGQKTKWSSITTFDGEVSRIRLNDGETQVQYHRVDNGFSIQPHSLLFRSIRQWPLSTFMRQRNPRDAPPRIEYRGTETVDGLTCHVVAVNAFRRNIGKLDRIHVLWLAEDRNFLPVQVKIYAPDVSLTVPVGEGHVTPREFSPGLWYPHVSQYTHYDANAIAAKQPPEWRSKETWRISGVAFTHDLPAEMVRWIP